MADIKGETIALAALFQACTQIIRIAKTGFVDPFACAALFRGLIITNPQTVEDIYRPVDLKLGLKVLSASMSSSGSDKSADIIEVSKLAFRIIGLTVTIEKNDLVFRRLGAQIDELRGKMLNRYPEFEAGDPNQILDPDNIKDFSDIYQGLISSNFPAVMIYGEEEHLTNDSNQQTIRALLLTGVRSVVLWRQLGGRRRFLLFRRRAIAMCARTGAV